MTRWKILLLIGATAVLILLVGPFAIQLGQLFNYARHRRAAAETVESLSESRPPGVSARTWDDATGWATTAYHNVCFSDDHVQLSELKKFAADIEQRCAGDVDLSTIDWIWKRLAETGPHGKQYVARFEPAYRELVYGTSVSPAPVLDLATP